MVHHRHHALAHHAHLTHAAHVIARMVDRFAARTRHAGHSAEVVLVLKGAPELRSSSSIPSTSAMTSVDKETHYASTPCLSSLVS